MHPAHGIALIEGIGIAGPPSGMRRASGESPEGACARIPIVSPFITNDTLLECIRFLKFSGGKTAVPPLSWWMSRSLARHGSAPGWAGTSAAGDPRAAMIIPVPLHPARKRERGYNQALLLAECIAESSDLDCRDNVLERTRNTKRQSKLARGRRSANVCGAFKLVRPGEVSGRDVILVDDLVTSGETVRECIRALSAGEPRSILVLSAGRTGSLGCDCNAPSYGAIF
jgi:ComF family protein